LTAYLLTADLVYAEKVVPPTLEEVGQVIWSNDMGSLAGLDNLGYTLQRKKKEPVQNIIVAFREVYEYLDSHLSHADKALMVFDPIMVEHTLCKYKHLSKHCKGK
ncbi:hypothetical protein LXA43DRAFT_893137, partial [Ganoderma leucocontextum]